MPAVFVLIWSTGFIVARYGMPHAPPLSFLVLRYAVSLALFAGWIAVARPPWPQGARQWGHLAVTGTLLHAGYLSGVWAAVKAGIGAGTVALVVGLQPVLTALWMSSRAGEGAGGSARTRIAPAHWAGLALGLAGLVLVVRHKLGVGEVTALNLSLGVGALVSITAGTLYQKRHVAPCDVRTAATVQLLAAFAVTLPLSLFEAEPVRWAAAFVGALLWSTVVLTLGGSSLYYLLIQRGAATRVSSLMYLVPPTTAVFAWALFGEPLDASMLAGMALAAAGVALVVRS